MSQLEPARTQYLGLNAQYFENSIFKFGCFSLKAEYNSWRLQRFLQVEKFLIMYFFTHTQILFFFRQLPTEIVSSIVSVSVVIACPFLGAGFDDIPPTFLISYAV